MVVNKKEKRNESTKLSEILMIHIMIRKVNLVFALSKVHVQHAVNSLPNVTNLLICASGHVATHSVHVCLAHTKSTYTNHFIDILCQLSTF